MPHHSQSLNHPPSFHIFFSDPSRTQTTSNITIKPPRTPEEHSPVPFPRLSLRPTDVTARNSRTSQVGGYGITLRSPVRFAPSIVLPLTGDTHADLAVSFQLTARYGSTTTNQFLFSLPIIPALTWLRTAPEIHPQCLDNCLPSSDGWATTPFHTSHCQRCANAIPVRFGPGIRLPRASQSRARIT